MSAQYESRALKSHGCPVGDWAMYGNSSWEDYNDGKHDPELTPEVKVALEVAEKNTSGRSIQVRNEFSYGSHLRKPLDGITLHKSNIIRHIIALKFGGYPLHEAFDDAAVKFEILPNTIEKYFYHHADAVKLAKAEHLEFALEDFHSNLISGNAMLSESVPLAVRTLTEVMQDSKASANVKAKTAIAVLKMSGVGAPKNSTPPEDAALESLKLIKDMRSDFNKEKDSHIIDAEDAEVVREVQ